MYFLQAPVQFIPEVEICFCSSFSRERRTLPRPFPRGLRDSRVPIGKGNDGRGGRNKKHRSTVILTLACLRHILYFRPTRNGPGNLPLDWASIPAKLGSRDSRRCRATTAVRISAGKDLDWLATGAEGVERRGMNQMPDNVLTWFFCCSLFRQNEVSMDIDGRFSRFYCAGGYDVEFWNFLSFLSFFVIETEDFYEIGEEKKNRATVN